MVLARRIRGKEDSPGSHCAIERSKHDPRLHARPGGVGSHFDDGVHVAGEIDLDARAYRTPVQTGAHASRHEREPCLGGVLTRRVTSCGVARTDDAQRHDLGQPRVSRVQSAGDRVELDVAFDERAQMTRHGMWGYAHGAE